MPHTIRPVHKRFAGLLPSNRSERRTLSILVVTVLCAIIAVAGFGIMQHHRQQVRELTWRSATGTVEEVRPILVTQVNSERGSAMLYQAQLLVAYSENGTVIHRWITLRHTPQQLASIAFEATLWKGSQCIVRWNPDDSSQIDAEWPGPVENTHLPLSK